MADENTGIAGGTGANAGGGDAGAAPVVIDLQALKTKSGKGIADFTIPQSLLDGDHELIDLVMKSEAMDDGERQYWFNLTEVMNAEQIEKLRSILRRERRKLAEIHAKYGKKPPIDPAVAAAQAKQKAEERLRQREALRAKEAAETKQNVDLDADAWA